MAYSYVKNRQSTSKKKITAKLDIKIILEYSAKKRKQSYSWILNIITETSSDSASGKSKGTLLVSANIDTKNKINEGNKGIIKKTSCCAKTIVIN